MQKRELLDEIRQRGVEAKVTMSKNELQEIYDKLPANSDLVDDSLTEVSYEQPEEVKPDVEPVTTEEDDLLKKIQEAQAPQPKELESKPLIERTKRKKTKKDSSPDSFRIEGYVFLLIVDTIFPFAFAFLNNLIDKKIKITADQLQLAEKDFTKLEPLADQAADYMSVNLNPIAGFLIVSTFMYSNNLIMIRMQTKG